MSTVRRLYFYILVLVSMEVVLWGVVGLLRTILSSGLVGGVSLLAAGLSLVIVGIPIFLLHWRTVQRESFADPVERASRIRAIFLYAALLATAVPMVFALLAILNRALVQLLGQSPSNAWYGAGQSEVDNLIAFIINAFAFGYFWSVLRGDWKAAVPENFLAETRRLYRYLWMIFGLTLTVAGVYNLLTYVLSSPWQKIPVLAGGLTMLLVGTPIWAVFWWLI